ncbi:FadR family transcriptional regulator [Labilibaculum sp. DW002]|uniref:FadR family transcriptional regulator n=1 Tax=Paralabilibaculum antarcticum TaxID=2912572 RepID=A0ABT5VYG7_9BACT|nr:MULTISPECIES: FadR/GntR family transcriptional regulator [unclassified Labilibaculum]MBI9059118.1 FadR family transcriptional regulator [Labilibaculum sp.]MDE5420391.1 FadR family transcriptional regulator [Labilibaculum sp. DW002]
MEEIFGKIGSAQTLSQKIERRIEEAIRQKKLLVGAKLPSERELCEMFAVSRTALREALRRLSARGLIQIKKGSGMFVSELKITDAIDSLNLYYDLSFDSNLIPQIIEVRRVFEPEIARMAANNRTDKDLELLQKSITDLEDCDSDNTQMEADIINKFHLNVAKATGNPIVIITMEPVYSLLPRMRNLIYANVDGEKDFTIKAHRTIFEAIRDKDADKAYKAMVEQINRTLEIYTQYLKK